MVPKTNCFVDVPPRFAGVGTCMKVTGATLAGREGLRGITYSQTITHILTMHRQERSGVRTGCQVCDAPWGRDQFDKRGAGSRLEVAVALRVM